MGIMVIIIVANYSNEQCNFYRGISMIGERLQEKFLILRMHARGEYESIPFPTHIQKSTIKSGILYTYDMSITHLKIFLLRQEGRKACRV